MTHVFFFLFTIVGRVSTRLSSFDNWIQYAQKEFEKREDEQNPWLKDSSYEDFDLAAKLLILTNLCEWQLDDPERFRSKFKQEEEVAMDWVSA